MSNIKKNIDKYFHNGREVDKALQQAVKEALLKHKKAGNPGVLWRNSKIVWIQHEDIPVEGKNR